ncbi:hypothetical protein [Moorena sp. SIO3H5]|uniref:hypothetical protein n=1 Tax=Moorena sp. SIO3H5 TaxID=2607834 RepID=UPI0013B68B91|nr:hypothetical protein [Moorena sp. SIO3H5]NEO74107.1 hypothetical protein [Moorena sp. SIO3H5]
MITPKNPSIPIPDSRFPIPNSQFPIPDSQFPIPNSRFPVTFFNQSYVYISTKNSIL